MISLHYDFYSFICQYVCFVEKHPADSLHINGEMYVVCFAGVIHTLSASHQRPLQQPGRILLMGFGLGANMLTFSVSGHTWRQFLEWFLEEIVSRFLFWTEYHFLPEKSWSHGKWLNLR